VTDTFSDVSTRSEGNEKPVEQAKEKVGELAQQASQKVSETRVQGQQYIRKAVEDQSSQAGQKVHSIAQDVRSIGSELRNQGKETPARYADTFADQSERLASYLRTTDGERMLRDAEQFARRNPWAVIAGGIAAGFVAARFLKASSQKRTDSSLGSSPPMPSAPGTDQSGASPVVERRSAEEVRGSLENRGYSTPEPSQVSGYSDSPVAEGP
jgi:hypothetical protein